MMKVTHPVKTEHQAAEALRLLLEQVPVIEHLDVRQQRADSGVDLIAHFDAYGHRHALACEVKSSGQPRHVRQALLQLRNYVERQDRHAIPVLIAPYLTTEAQALCREYDVGFLDFEGNAHLVFEGIFVERQVASRPAAERRELRSLFKPKSAQVLRLMLREPKRAWRVTELGDAAEVSLGHISNVRSGLLNREWAQLSDGGMFLSNPDALLDAWRKAYEPPVGRRYAFYTTLHGASFEDVMRGLQPVAASRGLFDNVVHRIPSGLIALASFSAAQWLAPYGRTSTHYFYADEEGFDRLHSALKLSAVSKGENVVVTVLDEPGVFHDSIEPAPGVICTGYVQTYLDLSNAGERGREAADHLRREKLQWLK